MSFLFGLDYWILKTLAVTVASTVALAFAYYFTKDGIPALDLTQEDLADICTGALKGALHTDDIGAITSCIEETTEKMEDVKADLQ